jgi:tRNA G10  N-methylase Trm11
MQVAILGRQHKISLAELEVLFGAHNVTSVGTYAAVINTDKPLPQDILGGTQKTAKLLTRLEGADLPNVFSYLQKSLPEHLQYLDDGKLQLGVSVYGFEATRDWLLKQMLILKKIIKKSGRSVRIIENKSESLESAQVLYNKLTSSMGMELLLIKDGNDVIIAQTTQIQDIDAYSERDFGRPMRDTYVGMLPPKLAQIMINLACGTDSAHTSTISKTKLSTPESQATNTHPPMLVLDPFCGTGVVLQEAILMGHSAYGTDISTKMIEYSTKNIEWLQEKWKLENGTWKIETGDATTHQWNLSATQSTNAKLAVVCETYLGKPLTHLPAKQQLDQIIAEANIIAEGFLQNIAHQIPSGTKLCIALPAWHLEDNTFKHLKLLDHLTDLGYNRIDLKNATKSDLIYHREDQIVARELTILEKI